MTTIPRTHARTCAGNDIGFSSKLRDKCVADPSFKRPVSSRTSFGVHHYAGEVVYTALGFCEKNKDTLQPALIELLASSQSDFVRSLVPYEHQASEQTRRKSTLLMDTLTAQFKMQLNKLVFVINSTKTKLFRV